MHSYIFLHIVFIVCLFSSCGVVIRPRPEILDSFGHFAPAICCFLSVCLSMLPQCSGPIMRASKWFEYDSGASHHSVSVSAGLGTFLLCESTGWKPMLHTVIWCVCGSVLICSFGTYRLAVFFFSPIYIFHRRVIFDSNSSPAQIPPMVARVPVSVWYLEIRTSKVSHLIWSSTLRSGLCGKDCSGP